MALDSLLEKWELKPQCQALHWISWCFIYFQSDEPNTNNSAGEKQADLERQIFQLSQENIELRFDAEQAKSDLPRLRQRIKDLEGYNEALKADLERERERVRSRPSSAASSLRRVSYVLG